MKKKEAMSGERGGKKWWDVLCMGRERERETGGRRNDVGEGWRKKGGIESGKKM